MVLYLTAKDGTPLYVGKDKYENEDLIKYGWPEDIWFHVDNLSSPHVYVRMPAGKCTMDDLTEDAIRDASQWCKQGSIEGCKKSSVVIIYTPWSNLRKEGHMAAGQVAFHNEKLVRKYVIIEKDKDVLKRLEKTLVEKYPDLAAERKSRDDEEKAASKAAARDRAKAEKALDEARRKEKEERSYDRLFKKDASAGGGASDRGAAAAGGAATGGAGTAAAAAATEDATASVAFEEDFM